MPSLIVPEVPLAKRSASGVEAVMEMTTEKDLIGVDMLVEVDVRKIVGKTLRKK